MKLIVLVFISFTALTACGIKGPPLPPAREETIQKQKGGVIGSTDTTKGLKIKK